MKAVDAADEPDAIVQVTVCPLTEQPPEAPASEALLMLNPESMVSETVAAAAVGPPVLDTVRVIAPGPAWKIGLECVAEIERDAGGANTYAAPCWPLPPTVCA